MTATLVTGGVDGVAYRDPPPKFTFTDTPGVRPTPTRCDPMQT
jgi:hypothetical protein